MEPGLLANKLRYGVLGAGLIPDALTTIKLAAAEANGTGAQQASTDTRSEGEGGESLSGPSTTTVVRPKTGLAGKFTREEVLHILAETSRVQGLVQVEITSLVRRLLEAMPLSEKSGKKKKLKLSFLEAHEKIKELGLPREPLEERGMTDSQFQKVLASYEEDEEVMTATQSLLHPVGKTSDPEKVKEISVSKIVEIHQFMVQEMNKVLVDFLQLPTEVRRTFSAKACETTAELLVSIAVEQTLGVRCDDVEQAVLQYEQQLHEVMDFARCTEQLAQMMQHLTGAAQPRVDKEEFLVILKHLASSNQKGKAFAKKVHEDYRLKQCNIADAYRRFEAFAEEASRLPEGMEEMPELSTVEMQVCFSEYQEDEEVRRVWEQAGVENTVAMHSMMVGAMSLGRSAPSTPLLEDKKSRKFKPGDVLDMQELMVDELKRMTEASKEAIAGADLMWKAEVAVQMVQSLASAAVERRYGVSAEEMTLAGFQNAGTLQKNERFMRATEKQQEILMSLAKVCSQDSE